MRDADAEAPAGGASTSVNDMTKFIRLQLGDGTFEGTEIIDAAALQQTHLPHQELHPLPPNRPCAAGSTASAGTSATTATGGSSTDHWGHCPRCRDQRRGDPGEDLGIVTLTNGPNPTGYPEAINNAFFDVANERVARRSTGWPTTRSVSCPWPLRPPSLPAEAPGVGHGARRTRGRPQPRQRRTVGTYQNPDDGPLSVTSDGCVLSMTMGPDDAPTTFALTHFDGNTFTYQTIGENGTLDRRMRCSPSARTVWRRASTSRSTTRPGSARSRGRDRIGDGSARSGKRLDVNRSPNLNRDRARSNRARFMAF